MKTSLANHLAALLCGLVLSVSASAQNTNWNVTYGDWLNPANWDAGLPDASITAFINNSGTIALATGSANVRTLYFGTNSSGSGALIINGNGMLTVADMVTARSPNNSVSVSGSGVLRAGSIVSDYLFTISGSGRVEAIRFGVETGNANITIADHGYLRVAGADNNSYMKLGVRGNHTLTLRDDATVQTDNFYSGHDYFSTSTNTLVIASDRARIIDLNGDATRIFNGGGSGFVTNIVEFTHSGSLVFANSIGGGFGSGTATNVVAGLDVDNNYIYADAPFNGTLTVNHSGNGVTRLTGTIGAVASNQYQYSYNINPNGQTNFTVSAGTLLVDGVVVTTGRVADRIAVKNGATLGGSGTIFSNHSYGGSNWSTVIVEAGATLQPGGIGEVGTLTLGNDGRYFLLNGSALVFDVASSVSYDRLLGAGGMNEAVMDSALGNYVNGVATVADLVINFLPGFDYAEGRQYTLDLSGGGLDLSNANLVWRNLDPNWEIIPASLSAITSLSFQLQQIPEPAAWTLWLGGAALALSLSRFRRRFQKI